MSLLLLASCAYRTRRTIDILRGAANVPVIERAGVVVDVTVIEPNGKIHRGWGTADAPKRALDDAAS